MKRQKILRTVLAILVLFSFSFMAMASGSSESETKTHDAITEEDAESNDNSQGKSGETKETVATEANTMSYEITSTRFEHYTNSINDIEYYAFIEIENTGTTNIYLDDCVFDFEDDDGHLLMTDDFIYSVPNVIEPGEKGYFYNGLGSNLIDDGVSLDNGINLVPTITVKEATNDFTKYDVTDTDMHEDSIGYLKITGRVVNNTDEDADRIDVGMIFYNADGEVIGVESTSVRDVPAGGKVSFEKSLMMSNDNLNANTIANIEFVAISDYYQW